MIIQIKDTIDSRDRFFLININDISCVTLVNGVTCIQFISRPKDMLVVGMSPEDIMNQIKSKEHELFFQNSVSFSSNKIKNNKESFDITPD